MNKLLLAKRTQILAMLSEGSYMRSISCVCRRVDVLTGYARFDPPPSGSRWTVATTLTHRPLYHRANPFSGIKSVTVIKMGIARG